MELELYTVGFFFFFLNYRSIVSLQNCISFYCIHVHVSLLFWVPIPSGHSRALSSFLCYTLGSHWLFILYKVVYIYIYIYICQSQH